MNEVLQIDIDGIIKSKSVSLYKKIPKFIIRYLKKIIHQDEINEFLLSAAGKEGHDFVDAVNVFLDIRIKTFGFEDIPDTGRFIFVANHPLGGLESMAMMKIIAKKYRNFVFVVNDILMHLTPMKDIFVPVNKIGSQSRENVKLINDIYKSDKQILYFPAGLVSRKIKGKIVDLKWQKSFVARAVETQRDVIPIYIEGKNSNFFYNLAKFRKKIGIKFNIEMLFLVNEMFKQRGQTIKLYFGKSISYKIFDSTKNYAEWAEYLKKEVYSIEKNIRNKDITYRLP
ncbi:1-acyl-sn-glycerol-3-phosphate acyltransferase [Bacteroidales bacterium OttesenSCG-928-I21]|nr:1-acyl-sn-glycerol-3-phosphate acyltransferase [Bacteroidales bacterium OttesenSCG-928-I21]